LVKPKYTHPWPDNYRDAVDIQEKYKSRLITVNRTKKIKYVAGADVSYSKGSDKIYSSVVVMAYPGMEVVEEAWAEGTSGFPYIPGVLSFREGPIVLEAFAKLRTKPDLLIFDGQGLAHPRGFGLASHMGVLLDIPAIGCAKTVLVGEYDEPDASRGSKSPMVYKGNTVGIALRTKDTVNPVFVSVGHKVDLKFACKAVLECAKGYRLPEPTRRAHILVNKIRKENDPSPQARGLVEIYEALYAHYGPQHWWPGETPFEVMVGAILTQNTNWQNVEKAIVNLKGAGVLSARAIHDMPEPELAELIRPSGYFNIKARRLKAFIDYFITRYGGSIKRMKAVDCGVLREEVLAVNGIGPETADSILLYALGCPTFVVDAYTKRVFSRHGFFPDTADYHEVQKYFTDRLPKDVQLYNEYHALIVRLAKDRCLKKAGKCELCLLMDKEQSF
jgi:endonuclease-3 related protein